MYLDLYLDLLYVRTTNDKSLGPEKAVVLGGVVNTHTHQEC